MRERSLDEPAADEGGGLSVLDRRVYMPAAAFVALVLWLLYPHLPIWFYLLIAGTGTLVVMAALAPRPRFRKEDPSEHAEAIARSLPADVDRLLGAATDLEATIAEVAAVGVPSLGTWAAVYLVDDDGQPERRAVYHPDPMRADLLEHALRSAPLLMNREHPLALVDGVIANGRTRVVEAPEDAMLDIYGRIPTERHILYELSPSALVAVPLIAADTTIGALVYAHTKGIPTRAKVEGSVQYAKRAALAIQAARLMQQAEQRTEDAERARTWVFTVFETLASGFVLLDADWNVLYCNGAAAGYFGVDREGLERHSLWDVLPENILESPMVNACREAARTREVATVEFKQAWNGTATWLEVQAHQLDHGMAVTLRDVSQRRQTEILLKEREEEVRQAQKMEAVGRLAGGVAHDFNNILMSISGYTDMALQSVDRDSEVVPHLQEVQRSAERAASLTRQLLMYSRKQVYQPQAVNLNAVVMDLQKTLLRLLGEDITLLVYAEPALETVMADPTQVEQMVMNLALNARDAMPAGGTVVIRLAEVRLRGTEDLLDRLPPGAYAEISVQDTGTGIPEDVLPHIFEPFYTTKPKGSGTGLGLSTTYGIIHQNGGSIAVSTGRNQGTTFRIYLPMERRETSKRQEAEPGPAVTPRALPERPKARTARAAKAMPKGGGVILVAEDEESVRLYVSKVLRDQGYTVLEARNGIAGLAEAKRYEGTIDLLLADVMMPGMGGPELARKLTEERPGTAVVFMSGYAENEVVYEGELDPGITLIEKPFGPGVLLERVQEALTGEAQAATQEA